MGYQRHWPRGLSTGWAGRDVFPNRVVTYETWIALLLGQRDALPVWQRMLLLEADAVFGDVLPS